jgi:site-specific DNA-methyltransferase (adenine-specific)
MKPYYQDEQVTLYHGDCMEITEWLYADVLITDPPYGMAYVSNSSKKGKSKAIAGDANTIICESVLDMWQRFDHGSESSSSEPLRPALAFGTWRVERPKNIIQLIVWDKGDSPGMGDLSVPWGPAHEEIYVIGTGWHGKRRPNVYRVPTLAAQSHARPNHPTPKPVVLMEQLVSYAPPGVIADPFAGGGQH